MPPTERENKIKFYSKDKKIKNNWPGPKNSGPNPRSFRFLVGGTLSPRQVGPLLDEILATYLDGDDDDDYYCDIIVPSTLTAH